MSIKPRINQEIKNKTINLITTDKSFLEDIPLSLALEKAALAWLDLVEINPKNNPPICKIMDYGQYLYNKKKLEKKASNKSKTITKTIRLSLGTSANDIMVKQSQAEKFLKKKYNLKLQLILKGREINNVSIGIDKMNDFINRLEDVSKTDAPPKKTGYSIIAILVPK